MAHFIPCNKSISAIETVGLFLANVVRLHGVPLDIVSDRGPQFVSRFWRSFHKCLGTTTSLPIAFHPESDGQRERVNQILEQNLRCYTNYAQNNWTRLLPLAEFAYNNSVHTATKHSHFVANYRFNSRLDFNDPDDTLVPTVRDKITTMKTMFEEIQANMKKAQEQYSMYANQYRKPAPKLLIGYQVWLSSSNIKTTRPNKKLDYKRLGSFRILEQINPVVSRIQLPPSMNVHNVFHVSLLEPMTQNDLSARQQAPPHPVKSELTCSEQLIDMAETLREKSTIITFGI